MNQQTYDYSLDPSSAKSSSEGGIIDATGEYIGTFTKVMETVSSGGNPGIEFDFESENGQTAKYMTIWLNKGDGTKNDRSWSQLHAIMACVGVRGVNKGQAQVEVYDKAQGSKVLKTVTVLPELMGKPIGLLLQKELSTYQGKDQTKMSMHTPYNATTRQTAKEVLEQTDARELADKLSYVKDYDRRTNGTTAQPAQAAAGYAGAAADDFSDDIPF